MAGDGIRFFEGFETDDTLSVWEDLSGFGRFTANKRSGTHGARCTGALGLGGAQSPLFTPTSEAILGFAFKPAVYTLGSLPTTLFISSFLEPPGNIIANLEFTQQRTFGINGQYSNRSLELDAWYYVEWYLKRNGAAGESIIRVNGDEELGATVNVGTGTINQFGVGRGNSGGNSDTDLWYDDIYIRDALIGGFLGDSEVIGTGLEGDFAIQFIRNSLAANYLTQIETTPDEDTTHVESPVGNPGPITDLYVVGDTAYQGTIHAVQLVSRGRKTSTHLWHLRNKIQVAGLAAVGPNYAMSYPNYETFPPTVFPRQPNGTDWDLAAFNAMVAGFEAEAFENIPTP